MRSRVVFLALLCLTAFIGAFIGASACTGPRTREAPLPDGVVLLTAHIEILGPG